MWQVARIFENNHYLRTFMYSTSAFLQTDLLVTAEDGVPHLLVEVRSHAQAGRVIGQALWRQVVAEQPGNYLLFITNQRFWLWQPGHPEPVYEGDTADLLARYIQLDRVPLSSLDGRELTTVVYAWLGSIIFKPAAVLAAWPAQQWLVESGLHSLIYRGYIQWEETAA